MQMRIVDGEGADRAWVRVRAFEADGDPAQAASPHPARPMIVVPHILAGSPDGCWGRYIARGGGVVIDGSAGVGRKVGHTREVGGWRPGGSWIRHCRRSVGRGCHRISEAGGGVARKLARTGCG